jgi:hypothetical protein
MARVWETAQLDSLPTPPLRAMRDIDLRLPVDNHLIDIQLRERSGLLDVSVRTADPTLAREMRADLGELVRNLESKGYEATTRVQDDGLALRTPERFGGNGAPEGNPDSSGNGTAGQDSSSSHGRRQGRQQQRHRANQEFSIDRLEGEASLDTGFQGGNKK